MGWYPCLEGNGAPFKVLNECYIGALWTVFSRLRVFINSGIRGRKPFIKKKERKREKKNEWLWNTMTTYEQLNSDYDFFERFFDFACQVE